MKEFCGIRLDEVNQSLGDNPKASVLLETLPWHGYVRLVEPGRARHELDSRLGRAMTGQRQIVLVTGEPGIGKTARLNDFQWRSTTVLQTLGNPGRDLPD
jgi:hypothetical protein